MFILETMPASFILNVVTEYLGLYIYTVALETIQHEQSLCLSLLS